MTVDEAARRGLEDRLETVLGTEHATTLMRYLPWEELATKQDLKALERASMGSTSASTR